MSQVDCQADSDHDTIIALLSRHEIQGSRVKRAVQWELRGWTAEEMELLLAQLRPLERIRGNKEPCGPRFNKEPKLPLWLMMMMYFLQGTGFVCLAPIQACAGLYLAWHSKWRAIWDELPRATVEMANLFSDTISFIKPDLETVQKGLKEGKSLCVNRYGRLHLRENGYALMSHVWGETHGWQTPTDWGAVNLDVRKLGMPLAHIRRCLDACDVEWLWLDSVAMPQVLEDMDGTTVQSIERTRIDMINQLGDICKRADCVIIVDSALLRLDSASMIDAAAILSVGFWMHRLWPMVECRLGNKVILKTHEGSFDLDMIIHRLNQETFNEEHRYYPLLQRLTPLRPTPDWGDRRVYSTDTHDDTCFQDAYSAGEGRHTNVDIDNIRVLFPLLGLKWEYGWTREDGMNYIAEHLPEEKETLRKWCHYRNLPLPPD